MEVRPSVLDDVLAVLRDKALPVAQAKPGMKSGTVLVDRAVGRVVVLTVWESQEASRADDTGRVIQQSLEELSRYVTSVMTTERYEVAFELPGLAT
jgi:quinol monooxygenase YgiN